MWEQIRANRRRSAVLVTGMAMVLLILGYAGAEALFGRGTGIFGLGVAIIIWGIQMSLYTTSAESILLSGAMAREISHADNPQLFNVVEEMSIAAGLGFVPHIYIIDDPSPNAFAIGRKPESSAIAVTTGLLYRLNRDELQGVIAHEIGHLKNRDVQFMTLAAIMLGSIVLLSEIVGRSLRFSGRSRDRSNSRDGGGQGQAIIMVVALVFAILGPIMAQLLYFACSRKREYLADASSAQYTRYPEGLASALEKISRTNTPVSFASKVTAPMFIINPLATSDEDSTSILSTHPATSERIRILRSMTGAGFVDYETAYRRAKNSSLIGAKSLRDGGPLGIRTASAEGPVASQQTASNISRRASGYVRIACSCGLETSVPEGYEQDSIRCVRCRNILPVPVAAPSTPKENAALEYHRRTDGWESFRCTCGRTIQLSPAFSAPHIRCTGCGQQINIL